MPATAAFPISTPPTVAQVMQGQLDAADLNQGTAQVWARQAAGIVIDRTRVSVTGGGAPSEGPHRLSSSPSSAVDVWAHAGGIVIDSRKSGTGNPKRLSSSNSSNSGAAAGSSPTETNPVLAL
ncbi:hypothetical protein HDU96_009475 [Phlyctochytrium bullatum]|nr:hypothetical protein HDU96_009475 [Phlyctochytrium bullatum]